MDKLDTIVNFDLPKSLVEREAKEIAHQLWHEECAHHGNLAVPLLDQLELEELKIQVDDFVV